MEMPRIRRKDLAKKVSLTLLKILKIYIIEPVNKNNMDSVKGSGKKGEFGF